MTEDRTTATTPATTTTGRVAVNPALPEAPEDHPTTSTGTADATNPGPHNADAHGPEHGATQSTEAQKLEHEAANGEENRY